MGKTIFTILFLVVALLFADRVKVFVENNKPDKPILNEYPDLSTELDQSIDPSLESTTTLESI